MLLLSATSGKETHVPEKRVVLHTDFPQALCSTMIRQLKPNSALELLKLGGKKEKAGIGSCAFTCRQCAEVLFLAVDHLFARANMFMLTCMTTYIHVYAVWEGGDQRGLDLVGNPDNKQEVFDGDGDALCPTATKASGETGETLEKTILEVLSPCGFNSTSPNSSGKPDRSLEGATVPGD